MSENVRAVELAIGAAGNMDAGWIRRVYENLGPVSALLREGSEAVELADKILQASVFKAHFVSWREEIPQGMNRPTRIIVTFQDDGAKTDKNPEGIEELRTEPLWTRPGRLMRGMVETLAEGQLCLIYKYTEQISGDKKARVLVHLEKLGRPPSGAGPSPTPPPAPSTAAAPPESPHPPVEPHSSQDNAALTEIEKLFEELSPRQRVAYAHWCRGMGITSPMAPDVEQVGQALDELRKLKGG